MKKYRVEIKRTDIAHIVVYAKDQKEAIQRVKAVKDCLNNLVENQNGAWSSRNIEFNAYQDPEQ